MDLFRKVFRRASLPSLTDEIERTRQSASPTFRKKTISSNGRTKRHWKLKAKLKTHLQIAFVKHASKQLDPRSVPKDNPFPERQLMILFFLNASLAAPISEIERLIPDLIKKSILRQKI